MSAVISLDRYRSSDAAAHYEARDEEAKRFAEARADNELRQKAAVMIAMGGQPTNLRVPTQSVIVNQPLAEVLIACLDHAAVLEELVAFLREAVVQKPEMLYACLRGSLTDALVHLLREAGGQRANDLRVAIADAFVKDTAEAITEIEMGLV